MFLEISKEIKCFIEKASVFVPSLESLMSEEFPSPTPLGIPHTPHMYTHAHLINHRLTSHLLLLGADFLSFKKNIKVDRQFGAGEIV